MPRVCSVCDLPLNTRRKVDRELLQGRSKKILAQEHGVKEQALLHHQKHHLYPQMVRHIDSFEQETTLDLFKEIEELMEETKKILDEARENKHNSIALKAISQLRGNLTLFAQIKSELYKQELLSQGITPQEVEEFRHWKHSRFDEDSGLETVIDSLSEDEKDVLFKISMDQIGETSGLPDTEPEKHPVESKRKRTRPAGGPSPTHEEKSADGPKNDPPEDVDPLAQTYRYNGEEFIVGSAEYEELMKKQRSRFRYRGRV